MALRGACALLTCAALAGGARIRRTIASDRRTHRGNSSGPLGSERSLAQKCDASVAVEWARLGLMVLEVKESKSHGYLGCENDRKKKQKISCDPKECDGDMWCWVTNSCGGLLHGKCSKIVSRDGVKLPDCSRVKLPSSSRALLWDVRTGRTNAPSPKTEEEIVALMKSEDPPRPVAEGWSFILSKEKPKGPIMKLRGNWDGLIDDPSDPLLKKGIVRVKTGTTYGSLKKHLNRSGFALYDRAQYDELSIGGAIRTAAHGWSTTKTLTETVRRVDAIKRGTGERISAQRGTPEFWQAMFDESYVLLSVDLEVQMNRDICVQQIAETFNTTDLTNVIPRLEKRNSGNKLFSEPYSMLFINMYGCLYKRASYYSAEDECWKTAGGHSTGFFHDRLVTLRLMRQVMGDFFGTEVLGAKIPAEYQQIDSVSSGHTMIKALGGVEQLALIALGDFNMELFIQERPDLIKLVPALAKFHKEHGGRIELRGRARGNSYVMALDLHLHYKPNNEDGIPSNIAAYLKFVSEELGYSRVTPHIGKFVPVSLAPLERVPAINFWQEVEEAALSDEKSAPNEE